MSPTNDIVLELHDIQRKLHQKKSEIEMGVDNLEEGKKAREEEKKRILLREMREVLLFLNDTDKKIVKDIKGEAFDLIRSVSKLNEEITVLKETINNDLQDESSGKVHMESLKAKVNNLALDQFLRSLDLSVSIQPGSMTVAFEKIADAIFLNSPVFNPKHFYLVIPERLPSFDPANNNSNFIDIQLFTVSASLSFNTRVLQKLMMNVTCQIPGKGTMVIEDTSVWTKIEKKKARLADDGCSVTIQLKRPNSIGKISISLLGSNIVNSPILHQFTNSVISGDHASNNLTQADDSIGIFSMTGLDDSDINSLDMTTRKQMLLSVGKQQLLANPTFPASPAFLPYRRVSRQPNISSVPEAVSLDQPCQLSSSTQAAVSIHTPDNSYVHQAAEDDIVAGLHNPASAVTLPLVESQEDPHLMLNASKAPSPQSLKCWQQEDSIWNEDLEDEPHLMLNSSKAPACGGDWPTVDPSWSNTSLLPEGCFNQSVLGEDMHDQDLTLWGEDAGGPVNTFDFLKGSLEVIDVFRAQSVSSSSSRGSRYCLESPCCLAFLPSRNSFLVTEPDHDRVGLYEAGTFKFVCWMNYPEHLEGKAYNFPTSVLTMTNGFVVLVERNSLHIFDSNVCHHQSMFGCFHGLAEGPEGEIFTLCQNSYKETVLLKLEQDSSSSECALYKQKGKITLFVVPSTDDLATVSNLARYIAFTQGKVIITDTGLHKLYTVDMTTGEQAVSGYMGSKLGQFKGPTGILADDQGFFLVGDSENNRFVVANRDGMLVKVIEIEDGSYSFPQNLVKLDSSVLAVFKTGLGVERGGAVVRYKVKIPGSEGPDFM